MLIRSLHLTNVRSYEQLSLEFPTGYMLFKGDIGSGKSTILMAVEFALFGLGSIKADSIISKKAKRCEVVLRFEVEGTEYEIGRAINKKDERSAQDPESSYISAGGVSEPLTPSDLKARVLEILNFNESPNPRAVSRVYRYAVYTPQEEIKSILEDRGDREEAIRKAFGMEDYKIAAENAGLVASRLNRERDKLSGLFANLTEKTTHLEDVRKQAANTAKEAAKLGSKITDLGKIKDDLERQVSAARDDLSGMDRHQAELAQVEKDLSAQKDNKTKHETTLDKDRDLLASTNQSIDECRQAARPTNKTESELDGLLAKALVHDRDTHTTRTQLEQRRAELATIREGLAGIEPDDAKEAAAQLEKDITADETSLREAEQEALDQAGLAGEKDNEVKMLADSTNKASDLGTRCEYCNTKLTPEYTAKLTNDRRTRLEKAMAELSAIKAAKQHAKTQADNIRTRLEENRKSLPKVLKEVEAIKAALAAQDDVARLDARLDELAATSPVAAEEAFPMADGESAHDYLTRLRDALAKHAAAVEREDLLVKQQSGLHERLEASETAIRECDQQITQLTARADELSKEVAGRDELSKKLSGLESTLEEARHDLLEAERASSAKKMLAETLDGDASRLKNEITDAKKHMKQHKTYGDSIEWLKGYFVPALREIERDVMNSLRADFNGFYSTWYTELVDDPTKKSYIDERFGPVIEQDGFQQEFAHLSGGEKTSVSLAYRLALNSTMRRQAGTLKSNLLILDEPTDGFSKSQLVKVRTILASLEAEQVIMVSHEEELEGYVDHVYGVTKTEGVSEVAKVR